MILKILTSKKVFVLIFGFSLLTFFAHTYFTKSAIFADGRFYFATTRSLVKDFDIDFENDFPPLKVNPTETVTGYIWNKYPPGSSIAWVPLYFVADGISNILENIGMKADTEGYGSIYQSSVAISSIILGILGLLLILKLLSDYFPEKISYLTVLTLFGTTNLLFYIAVEPINSHAISFFASTLFVFYFLKYKNDKHYYFILGLLGGIAGLVRTQDLLILSLPTLKLFYNHRNELKKLVINTYYLTTGFLIAFLPQMYFWKRVFGTFWYSPYINEGFNLSPFEIFDTLFNSLNGLFYITPVIAASFIGLLIIWKNNSKSNLSLISSYALIYFLTQLFLVTFWAPSIGGSYSNRMMITTYSLVSFGLAKIVELAYERSNLNISLIFISIFGLNNVVQIINYLLLY